MRVYFKQLAMKLYLQMHPGYPKSASRLWLTCYSRSRRNRLATAVSFGILFFRIFEKHKFLITN